MVAITSYVHNNGSQSLEVQEYITHIESSPFNLHGFQNLLYCTLVYEITKGLPSTLVRRIMGKLCSKGSGRATVCCNDWILICLGLGASEDGKVVGSRVEIVRHELGAQGFEGCFEGIGTFGAKDIPLLSSFT